MGQYLEAVCNNYLSWQVRKSLFTYNTLVGWASSSEHLARDGALRAAGFLRRIARGEIPIRGDADGARSQVDDALRSRTVQLGVVVFVVSLIMTVTGERVEIGINLFTAEVVFIASAAMMLLRTIGELSKVR